MTEDNSGKTAVSALEDNYDDAVTALKQRRSEFVVGGGVLTLWLLRVGEIVTFPIADELITAGALLTLILSAMSDRSAFSEN